MSKEGVGHYVITADFRAVIAEELEKVFDDAPTSVEWNKVFSGFVAP